MARDLRAAMQPPKAKWMNWKSLAAAAVVVIGASALILSKHSNSEATAHLETIGAPTNPAIPANPTNPAIKPQQVQLTLWIQQSGKTGSSQKFDDDIDHVETSDRLQINAQIPSDGYFYVLWFKPNGEVSLSNENDLSRTQLAIQDPPVDDKTPWNSLSGAAGKNLVVAFTRETPLQAEEAEMLKHTSWETATDWLSHRTLFKTGFPRVTKDIDRGNETKKGPTEAEMDQYLGKLGTLLKRDWNCCYQAVVFRVN
jgi:hypothetical protein